MQKKRPRYAVATISTSSTDTSTSSSLTESSAYATSISNTSADSSASSSAPQVYIHEVSSSSARDKVPPKKRCHPMKLRQIDSQNVIVAIVADRDHEASLGDSAYNSGLSTAVLGEKRKFSLLSSSSHSVPLMNFTPRRKTRPNPGSTVSPIGSNPVLKRCNENDVAASHSPIHICYVDSSSDHEGSDSDDDSCSKFSINDLLASLRIRKLSKMWMSQADKLRDFQEDVDHCLNAVCVLYRQKISIPGYFTGSNGEFSRFEAMGVTALAEYLIDGDLKYRLRKSISNTEEQRPDVLVQCRSIAMDHNEKLYSIYCNREDPFFRSR